MEAQLVFVHVTDVLPQDAHQHPQLALQGHFLSKTTFSMSFQREADPHLHLKILMKTCCCLWLAVLSLLKCTLGVVVSFSSQRFFISLLCFVEKSPDVTSEGKESAETSPPSWRDPDRKLQLHLDTAVVFKQM